MNLRQKSFSIFVITLVLILLYVIAFVPFIPATVEGIKEAIQFENKFPVYPQFILIMIILTPICLFFLEIVLLVLLLFIKKIEKCGMFGVPIISIIMSCIVGICFGYLSFSDTFSYNGERLIEMRIQQETLVCFLSLFSSLFYSIF